ncbi:hypothetical protein, partial [Faecalibacterium prausnitzii]|uniref:hypothetical protein n=1 Tax=Faecalibacterium prausnitzii TaxID=853 RepID=UPI0022E70DF9
SPEVGRGDSKHPSLPLACAERKPLNQKKKPAPRHRRENQLKENQPRLWPARSAKPFDRKRKPAPRHRRANLLKKERALMQSKHLYATALLQKSIFNLKECKK